MIMSDQQVLFYDDPEPSGFDSFFGGQRENGILKKIKLNLQTPFNLQEDPAHFD